MSIGETIRAARLGRNMTVAALAVASHLSKGFISQVESGRSMPSLASLARISEALDLRLPDLLRPAGEPNAPVRPGGDMDTGQSPRLPAVLHYSDMLSSRPGVSVLLSGRGGTYAVASLVPGAALQWVAAIAGTRMPVLGVVTKGSVELRQGSARLRASSGDALTWDAAQPCSIENLADSASVLTLAMPAVCTMPAVVARGHSASEPAPGAARGPFGLVAMRAERSGRRR